MALSKAPDTREDRTNGHTCFMSSPTSRETSGVWGSVYVLDAFPVPWLNQSPAICESMYGHFLWYFDVWKFRQARTGAERQLNGNVSSQYCIHYEPLFDATSGQVVQLEPKAKTPSYAVTIIEMFKTIAGVEDAQFEIDERREIISIFVHMPKYDPELMHRLAATELEADALAAQHGKVLEYQYIPLTDARAQDTAPAKPVDL